MRVEGEVNGTKRKTRSKSALKQQQYPGTKNSVRTGRQKEPTRWQPVVGFRLHLRTLGSSALESRRCLLEPLAWGVSTKYFYYGTMGLCTAEWSYV